MIANMRQAFSTHDAETFRREAHSMKTNAATFGATSLADLARSLEQLARENQLELVGDQLDLFESLYQKAYKALERLVNDK
jgi:HPt (histidine-containing phosphotransfer) domain-containing protein